MDFFSNIGVNIDSIFDSYTIIIAIVIGIAASISTIYYSIKLRGSLIGDIMNAFSLGILLVVLGFLSQVLVWNDEAMQSLFHDSFFILGFLSMLFGSVRMRKLNL